MKLVDNQCVILRTRFVDNVDTCELRLGLTITHYFFFVIFLRDACRDVRCFHLVSFRPLTMIQLTQYNVKEG